MIAKSDIIILAVATALLAISVSRWNALDWRPALPASSQVELRNDVPSRSAAGSTRDPAPPAASASGDTGSVDTPDTAPQPAEPADNTSTDSDTAIHQVVAGDSLGAIAARYDSSVVELQVINALEGTTIYVGQELRYPVGNN